MNDPTGIGNPGGINFQHHSNTQSPQCDNQQMGGVIPEQEMNLGCGDDST